MDIDVEDGDIDSDNAFGESDMEKFKDFSFRGSSKPAKVNGFKHQKTAVDFMTDSEGEQLSEDEDGTQELSDVDGGISEDDEQEHVDTNEELDEESEPSAKKGSSDAESTEDEEGEEEEEEEEEEDDESDDSGDEERTRRAELRKIMNSEQKTVVATISQAAKADAQKGNAIKRQRKTFDSFLNGRIRLQKALVATNSMVAVEEKASNTPQPYLAAEEMAIKYWNELEIMRQKLQKAGNLTETVKKRKRAIDVETPSSAIWQRMEDSELIEIGHRQSILEKWSSKVRGATAISVSQKLNNNTQSNITDVLQEQLSHIERLVKRTKTPRSCAPLQAQQKLTEDPNIYDDADFYQLLLKELVDQRMADSTAVSVPLNEGGRPITQWTAVKEAKTRKNVDTKASKGRKMRFTVHEKLQNFMAPEERGSWEPDAIGRFFGTLLGQKMSLGEDDGAESGDEEDETPLAEEALMLFRS
jgi:protein AATF/BFR2